MIIDKPASWTSHDVVGKLRGILKIKSIGHTGTLDPFATGVLVMLIGKATRLTRFLDKDIKEYEATVQFGFETATGDLTGEPALRSGFSENEIAGILSEANWDDVLEAFRGEIEQVPPMFSAKKIEGKKLYQFARKGIEVERKAVNVSIHKLDMIGKPQGSSIRIIASCSAGTYIRTLAEDIGRKLGIPCHLSQLRRIRAGKFGIEKAVSIEKAAGAALLPMNEAVSHLAGIKISGEELIRIKHGLKIKRDLEIDGQFVRLTDEQENLSAIGSFEKESQLIQPRLVFV